MHVIEALERFSERLALPERLHSLSRRLDDSTLHFYFGKPVGEESDNERELGLLRNSIGKGLRAGHNAWLEAVELHANKELVKKKLHTGDKRTYVSKAMADLFALYVEMHLVFILITDMLKVLEKGTVER